MPQNVAYWTHSGRGCIAKVWLARGAGELSTLLRCDGNAREVRNETERARGTATSAQAQKPEAQPPGLMKAARIRRKLWKSELKEER
jgi:hypothetical protein